MSNCGGAAESAMFCTDPALPSFAVPDERSWSRIATSDGVLQPGDDFRRGLRLLAIQCPATDDALDRLGHVQPGAAQWCVQRHHPVREQPHDH